MRFISLLNILYMLSLFSLRLPGPKVILPTITDYFGDRPVPDSRAAGLGATQ